MAFPKDKFPASVRTCSSRGYFHSLRFFIPTPPTARGSRERLTTFGVFCFFSALHGMPARTSDEKNVCLAVYPSVCQTRAL